MKKKRELIIFALILVILVVSLNGCSQYNSSSATESQKSSEEDSQESTKEDSKESSSEAKTEDKKDSSVKQDVVEEEIFVPKTEGTPMFEINADAIKEYIDSKSNLKCTENTYIFPDKVTAVYDHTIYVSEYLNMRECYENFCSLFSQLFPDKKIDENFLMLYGPGSIEEYDGEGNRTKDLKKLKIDVTQDFDGIVLHVESESDTYKTGENFKIIAQVTNNTQEPVFIFKNSPCGCTTESNETCSHSEIITSIIKDDIRLVDGDTFGKGEAAAYDCLKLEPGQSFTQRMNYVAAKPVPKDKSKEYKPMSRPAKVYDCNLEEQLIPADTGIYTGTSGILLCGGYDDTKFDETIIDSKYVSFIIHIIE